MSQDIARFAAAVSALARHGHIKQRLADAFERNLADVDEAALPVPMRQPFADLKRLMNRVAPLNGEGPIWASVRKMSVDEADYCAQLMVDLYGESVRHADGQGALPLADDEQPTSVPPFLVKSG